MGTAGELPKAPEKPTQFIEDMTDAERAEAVRVVFIYNWFGKVDNKKHII